MKVLDDKYHAFKVESTQRIDDLNKNQNSFDSELKLYGQDLDSVNTQFANVLNIEDGKRIWRHFQRFAEYNDLKELYNKCIP